MGPSGLKSKVSSPSGNSKEEVTFVYHSYLVQLLEKAW